MESDGIVDVFQVATFDMVEDFWGIFNNIRPPSRLNPGSNYHLFKVGIEPTWEHQASMAGGKWNYGCVILPVLFLLSPGSLQRSASLRESLCPADVAAAAFGFPSCNFILRINGWGCRVRLLGLGNRTRKNSEGEVFVDIWHAEMTVW